MKVYFSHGKESGPWGSKIKRLASIAKEHGCHVNSIDYTGINNPDHRVEHLLDILQQENDKFLLVGSSMGGYVSLVASEQVNAEAVFLMAPALYLEGYKQQTYHPAHCNVEIVHGWFDEIIPPEHSFRFAKEGTYPLHLIPSDHRLNSSLERVANIFEQFLNTVLSGMEVDQGTDSIRM